MDGNEEKERSLTTGSQRTEASSPEFDVLETWLKEKILGWLKRPGEHYLYD